MPRKRSAARQAPPAIPAGPGMGDGGLRATVTFAQAHTHRGVVYGKGDSYAATPVERELLEHFGVLERD